uniref:Ovule protein n=1 Tax=Strongyloides stercoralis TaxID=6248 RepID=A0A0K0EC81_STRER
MILFSECGLLFISKSFFEGYSGNVCKLFSDAVLDNHLARILISLACNRGCYKNRHSFIGSKKKCLIPIVDCQTIVCDVIKEMGFDELPKT